MCEYDWAKKKYIISIGKTPIDFPRKPSADDNSRLGSNNNIISNLSSLFALKLTEEFTTASTFAVNVRYRCLFDGSLLPRAV